MAHKTKGKEGLIIQNNKRSSELKLNSLFHTKKKPFSLQLIKQITIFKVC